VQQVLGPSQPIPQDCEEALVADLCGDVQVGRKSSNGLLVDLEEQAVLAAEVLKHRSLGDTQLSSNVTYAGGMIALLGEVPHRGIDDPGTLGLGSGTGRNMTAILRWTGKATGNSTHDLDLKSWNDSEK
jgi:hypothetical protein